MPFKLRIASMFNLICVRRSFATQLCERDPHPVFVQVAGGPMARFDFAKCRRLVPAARQRVGTARVEMAARRRVDLARNVALEDHAFAIPRTVFPKAVPRSNQRRALLQNLIAETVAP